MENIKNESLFGNARKAHLQTNSQASSFIRIQAGDIAMAETFYAQALGLEVDHPFPFHQPETAVTD